MRHWEDKGKLRVWRWVLLVYSLAAFVLSVIGAFTFRSDIILAAIFLTAASVLVYEAQLERGVIWFVIILLLLPTLPYGLIYNCYSFEIVADRTRSEGRILGVPIISVDDGYLTPYYREHISAVLPKPNWYPSFKGQIGLLGIFEPHTDYSSNPGSYVEFILDLYQASDKVRDAAINGFFALSAAPRPVNDSTNLYLTKKYAMSLNAVFMDKGNKATISDLPDPKKVSEEGMKELEKLKEQP